MGVQSAEGETDNYTSEDAELRSFIDNENIKP